MNNFFKHIPFLNSQKEFFQIAKSHPPCAQTRLERAVRDLKEINTYAHLTEQLEQANVRITDLEELLSDRQDRLSLVLETCHDSLTGREMSNCIEAIINPVKNKL